MNALTKAVPRAMNANIFIDSAQRRAQVPLGAGSRATHGFGVVVAGNHFNETAPSSYVARLVLPGYSL